MGKKSRGIIKDAAIVGTGISVIVIVLILAFGAPNPFYVVASGSMVPVLEKDDIIVVQRHAPFAEVEIGDIIVFDRPSDHNRVIVHRVASILDEDPKTVRTKGDANSASIPGTDFPITKDEYIGTVQYIIPQVGYLTNLLKPPINYIIIAVVIGIMAIKHFTKNKPDEEFSFLNKTKSDDDGSNSNESTIHDSLDLDKLKNDSEYTDSPDTPEDQEKSESKSEESLDSDKEKTDKNKDKPKDQQ